MNKQALEDLREDIEMLRDSGLNEDNEFNAFALRKITQFKIALGKIIAEAKVSEIITVCLFAKNEFK